MDIQEILFVVFVLLVFVFLGFALGVIYTHNTYFDFINSFCELIPIDGAKNAPSLVTP